MQGIRFSGTFTFNAQDRHAASAARLDSQTILLNSKEVESRLKGTEAEPLLISQIEAEGGDKFYIRTSPSRDNQALGKKDVKAMDNLLKDACTLSNIPFKYSR